MGDGAAKSTSKGESGVQVNALGLLFSDDSSHCEEIEGRGGEEKRVVVGWLVMRE